MNNPSPGRAITARRTRALPLAALLVLWCVAPLITRDTHLTITPDNALTHSTTLRASIIDDILEKIDDILDPDDPPPGDEEDPPGDPDGW